MSGLAGLAGQAGRMANGRWLGQAGRMLGRQWTRAQADKKLVRVQKTQENLQQTAELAVALLPCEKLNTLAKTGVKSQGISTAGLD